MKKWWKEGIRFQCQGSGKCCTSHGEFGFVFLTTEDRKKMAKHFGLTLLQFTHKYCQEQNGFWHLKEDSKNLDCMFLKDKKCGVYEVRPTQCRTWPFWPEVMSPKAWKKDVVEFCPGVGKGPVVDFETIERHLKEQIESELEINNN